MESRRFREVYRASLDPMTFIGQVRQECLTRYMSQLGVAPTALQPLSMLVWILHAQSDYQHLVADAGGQPAPEELCHSLFYRLYQEELRCSTAQ